MSSGFSECRRRTRPGAKVDPISATEDVFWRALMRIVLALPRLLDGDLVGAAGINFNEYLTLMSLSEAPGRQLRMSDLADATALSASRMTRLVDALQSRGWVTKRASAEDRRGNVASLTPAGLAKLETAWGAHLSSARALVFDELEPATSKDAAVALAEIAVRLEQHTL
jgi:DNA-binding MarR family transcriptional regulator